MGVREGWDKTTVQNDYFRGSHRGASLLVVSHVLSSSSNCFLGHCFVEHKLTIVVSPKTTRLWSQLPGLMRITWRCVTQCAIGTSG